MKLEEIKALIEAATPGPWEANGTGAYVAMMSIFDDKIRKYVSAPQTGMCVSDGDIAFIAASRTLLPKLLAVAEAAKAYVKAFTEPSTECLSVETIAAALAALESP